MDDTLVSLALKYDALRLELDRIVKQRNTLLKQADGRLNDELDDLARRVGREVRAGRRPVRSRAGGADRATGANGGRGLRAARRPAECGRPALRAGVASAGSRWRRSPRHVPTMCAAASAPSARTATTSTCSSAACRRALMRRRGSSERFALALRLAAHRMVAEKAGSSPVLVLDDVLSELDPRRSAALLTAPATRPGRAHDRRRVARGGASGRDRPHRIRRRAGYRESGAVAAARWQSDAVLVTNRFGWATACTRWFVRCAPRPARRRRRRQ